MKLGTSLRVAALAAALPAQEQTFEQALDLGLVEPQAEKDRYRALTMSHRAGPEQAVEAGGKALAAAGVDPGELDLVLHAWIYHQGHDFWSPAHYVAHQVEAHDAVAIGIQQMCNGGAMALELAATRMLADPDLQHALVTTGDRFAEPGFARWNCDYGVSYGDGGTAIVLGRRQGPFTLLSIAATGASQLEEMHRGDDLFSPAARSHGPSVDVRRTKKAFLNANGTEAFARTCARALRTAIETALADAGVLAEELALVALPRLGYSVLEAAYLPTVTELIPAPALVMGRRTGHLGAGDAAANLVDLHQSRALEAGALALLISGGAGFSWSCLVVRAEDAA